MSRLDQIRKELKYPSQSQVAWESLTLRQRYTFVRLARLTSLARRLIKPDFDNFHQIHKTKIAQAINQTAKIAEQFKAQVRPKQNKKLRVA